MPRPTSPPGARKINLHGVASRAVGRINPNTYGIIQPSAGSYTTDDAGKRTPTYGPPQRVPMQVQSLETRDLQYLDGLAIQGSTHKIYMTGRLLGIIRATNSGGDLVVLDDGQTYKVTAVLEQWPLWVCAAVTLQR